MTQVQSSRPSQYDPNQDPEEAAKLQQSLRAYNRRALDMEQSTSDSSSVSTLEAAQQVRQFLDELDLSNPDSVSSRIHQPAEAIMEAEAICAVVRSSRAISRNLPTGLTRRLTEGDFLAKVVTFMSPQGSFHVNAAGGGDDDDDDDVPSQQSNANTLDWTRLGSAAAPVFRRVPAMRVLHGPLSIIPPVRKVINRARASRDPDEKPHTTKVVDSTSLVKSEETDIRSRELLAILRGLEEVNVFKFVLNPASFSQSVENLFYLAFLVRDGHVEVFFDEATSMPMVAAAGALDEDAATNGTDNSSGQFLFSLNMQTWKDLIEAFDIRESMIPTRTAQEGTETAAATLSSSQASSSRASASNASSSKASTSRASSKRRAPDTDDEDD